MVLIATLGCLGDPAVDADPEAWEVQRRVAMGTTLEVSLPRGHAHHAERVFDAFRQVEEEANEWREGTPLADVNAAAGAGPVAVPDPLYQLLERGLALGDQTGGAFDITWGALWGLWDFRGPPALPDPGEVRRRVARVDHRRVALADGAVAIPAGTVIGLGGIAKGWALDRAAEALVREGVPAFALSAGGQITTHGLRDGRPWRVGIRDPRGDLHDWFAAVDVVDGSVSTSGDYERFFVLDGTRYHHILDPRTGWPSRGTRSATVVARSSTDADALSTALMVLGWRAGLEIVEATEGVEALVVDDKGAIHASGGMDAIAVHPPHP